DGRFELCPSSLQPVRRFFLRLLRGLEQAPKVSRRLPCLPSGRPVHLRSPPLDLVRRTQTRLFRVLYGLSCRAHLFRMLRPNSVVLLSVLALDLHELVLVLMRSEECLADHVRSHDRRLSMERPYPRWHAARLPFHQIISKLSKNAAASRAAASPCFVRICRARS